MRRVVAESPRLCMPRQVGFVDKFSSGPLDGARPSRLECSTMGKTTPKPCTNVVDLVPELAELARTTVRLHPRQGDVPELGGSKFGGTFLWPADVPWPHCDESGPPDWWKSPPDWPGPQRRHGPLVPVLQLRGCDVPEMQFPPGTDLFQLLWCPLNHSEQLFRVKPFVFWRNSEQINTPLSVIPEPQDFDSDYVPKPCRLFFERVVEFPHISDLPGQIVEKIASLKLRKLMTEWMDDVTTIYEWDLSVCPSNKVGGYVAWLQDPQTPACVCGSKMEHLVTLTACEFGTGTERRWRAKEDGYVWALTRRRRWEKAAAIRDAAGLDHLGGNLYLFICRNCDDWPIQSVYQR